MSTPAPRDDRAAVEKAVSLLASFGDQTNAGLGVSELARRAGLSKSTAFRLLGILERNGVVEKVGRKYRLGERLYELGSRVYDRDHDRIRDVLTPFLADLYELTHETVHLAALHGTDVVYLAKLYGHRQVRSPSRIGGRVPAYCTAVGKVLLAYDHEALEQVLRAELQPLTPNTITDPDRLAAEIAKVRAEGVAFDDEEATPGLSCIAVPVLGHGGRAVAAMSVSTATGRLDTRAQAPALRRVSAAAARHLMLVRRRPAPVRAIA
ncbi:IclR family transcriptional regulator [Actinomadura keratinilytica]|jgi:DNA-binding IclR family transcriptional regulator|uniref:IclR family transcriptional regulator n=1 Tax=Actinomadura keratinilytica TaxID=547461 RepID=A0ABP7Z9C4_9ACTN